MGESDQEVQEVERTREWVSGRIEREELDGGLEGEYAVR